MKFLIKSRADAAWLNYTAPQIGLFNDSNPMGFRSDFPSAKRELSDFGVLSASRTSHILY